MLNSDLQKLEPGNRIRLIEVDGTRFGADILRFHCDTLPFTPQELAAAGGDETKLPAKSVWWQGQEYGPWPFSVEGLEISADSQGNAPKLSVANINGLISALCLQFEDMAQAKVRIHDTLVHYLDARNFPQGTLRPIRCRKSCRCSTSIARRRKATRRWNSSSPARRTCGIAHSDPANPQPVHLVLARRLSHRQGLRLRR